jgi:hypothetical protein
MFHPVDHPMERGWVGRIDGDRVVQLAAQTLEAYFTGGGTAREHAVYPLGAVRLLAPVLHPPSVRVFDDEMSFGFANPAAIVGPDAALDAEGEALAILPRVAAVIGTAAAIGGFTGFVEWRRPSVAPPKDRDFALALGPVVVTPEDLDSPLSVVVRAEGDGLEAEAPAFDWERARQLAARGTTLRPGDILAGPAVLNSVAVVTGGPVEVELGSIGVFHQRIL